MKQGRTIQELATELERQSKTKRDFIAPVGALKFDVRWDGAGDDAIRLRILDNRNSLEPIFFDTTPHFHDQVGTRLEIPSRYYDKMLREAPQLLADNVNHWLSGSGDKRLIRTLDGKARAFLSDRYRPLDNYDLAQAILPRMVDMEFRIESCDVTEKKLYIKGVYPKIEGEVSPGDVVQSGICISNSEVGCGSLTIEPLLYRLICRNGAISADSTLKKYHVGKRNGDDLDNAREFYRSETRLAEDKAFWMKVQDLVSATLSKDQFAKIIERHQRAKGMKITNDPLKVVEVFCEQNALNEGDRGGILKYLIEGGELSLYGLANATTRYSQDVKDYDLATDLERLGGTAIEMPAHQWEELALSKN